MAEFRNPLIHSFLCNDPALVRLILRDRPGDFPKSDRLREGLAPLLGNSIFVTNGAEWARQRRIIDPAFEGGRLRDSFEAIWQASDAALARLTPGEIDIEPEASHAAADVIFRALFSLPIEHDIAARVFRAFRAHQDAQPIVNLAAMVPLPRWLPRPHSHRTRATAAQIRGLIQDLVAARMTAIRAGTAPADLASKIMTTPDPQTGRCFDAREMVDQVAIFFLAGHETSASALAWALWLLAAHPEWQDRVAAEGADLARDFTAASGLKATRAAFREALRLYPPVPMMVREATRPETFRDRPVPKGAQLVLSPWHLQRHQRLWDRPDDFDPGRWDTQSGKASARDAYIPFSAGQRVCPGAGFAMLEGVVMLARITAAFHLSPGHRAPVPVARLTVRGRDGILIRLDRREGNHREGA
ncbi:cytochrome P450 [Paracoccus siganidrum]|uniref:Cytochrome P450 n=2 Tax=Paracoccus siganidrum TaxID=1276757 RepID=A0A419A9G6_9RHOB|nr:cytochrome P450 [Paracoccus siganidrum]RMC39428.1 cytochrome P450 [Paracoccus siganidrum]